MESLEPIIQKINFPKKIQSKLKHFSSITLPQTMNNLAIQSAKTCIKGYKLIQGDVKYVKNFVKSKDFYKYFKEVACEANRQLSNPQKELSFRESLKVNPKDFLPNNKPIKISNNFNNVIDLYK